MEKEPLIKKEIKCFEKKDILPEPVYHDRGSLLLLTGIRCLYCGKNIRPNVERTTCKKCTMNYCYICIKHVEKYHTGNCLRCYGNNFSILYDNIPRI